MVSQSYIFSVFLPFLEKTAKERKEIYNLKIWVMSQTKESWF